MTTPLQNSRSALRRLIVLCLSLSTFAVSHAAESTHPLQAGSARVEFTPSADAVPAEITIMGTLAARALYVSAGPDSAVLVGVDQGGLSSQLVDSAIARAAAATGCAPGNIIISATHTHSGSTGGGGIGGGLPERQAVEDAIVEAIVAAKETLRPARLVYATPQVDLNTNRDYFVNGAWRQAANPDGVSDKTLATLAFLDAQGGLIGVYLNYAMHPINFYLSGVLSPDFPGAASAYVEARYPGAVAVFAQGASGDQNPKFTLPMGHLIATRTGSPALDGRAFDSPLPWDDSQQTRNPTVDLNAALAQPLPPERADAYAQARAETEQYVAALGTLIGETALNAIRYRTLPPATEVSIAGAQTEVVCPGRDRLDRANPVREGSLPPYADGDDVRIKVGVLRIGDVHLAWVNGEVYTEVAHRMQREAPVSRLLVTTMANGWANSGYIYSNNASHRLTFQVIGSRLKPGAAEDAIAAASHELLQSVAP